MKNQRGQAVLEYLLLLFVIVLVLGAIILGFSQSTQRFIQNYWGAYFQCLLETGELPSLGNQSNPNSECDNSFQPFTLASGRQPIDNSVAGNQGDQNKNIADQNANSNDDNKSEQAGASNGVGAGGSTGTVSTAGVGSGDYGSGFGRNGSKNIPLGKSDKEQNVGSGSDSGTRFNNFVQNDESDDVGSGRSSSVPASGVYANQFQEKKSESVPLVKKEIAEEGNKLTPRRVPANSEKKETTTADTDVSITLPDFLRYLIIIGIIIAIVIFFGSQILQFQKSQNE